MAIAGTDLFGMTCAAIQELDARFLLKVNVHVRVLLLDPRSYYAVERCLLEEKAQISELKSEEFKYRTRNCVKIFCCR